MRCGTSTSIKNKIYLSFLRPGTKIFLRLECYPKIPKREEFLPTTEDSPKYSESVLNDFSDNENFVPLSRNLKFIDYQNAQIILIGAR
jgi:hypothetical protein